MPINLSHLDLTVLQPDYESLKVESVEQYEQLGKQFEALLQPAQAYKNAYELCVQGVLSPFAYQTAMQALQFKSPEQLTRLYVGCEIRYFTQLKAYDSLARRVMLHFEQLTQPLTNSNLYAGICEQIERSRADLIALDPHVVVPAVETSAPELSPKAQADYECHVRNFINYQRTKTPRSQTQLEILTQFPYLKDPTTATWQLADQQFKAATVAYRCPKASVYQESVRRLKALLLSPDATVRPPLTPLLQSNKHVSYESLGYDLASALGQIRSFVTLANQYNARINQIPSTSLAAAGTIAYDYQDYLTAQLANDIKSILFRI